MSGNPLRLRYLFEKYTRNTCSPTELQELWALMREYAGNDLLDEEMKAWWDKEVKGKDPADLVDSQKLFRQVIEKEKAHHFSYHRWKAARIRPVLRWAAAAAVILVVGSAGYFLFFHKTAIPVEIAGTPTAHDVPAPKTNRAVIVLSNGQEVYLDSVHNGILARQGQVKVVKLANGKVAYSKEGGKSAGGETQYNTLINPRGSKVMDMTLADGSRVWLNAGSSITYPVAFSGSSREVSITGEAYFEVVHNSRMPFKVKAGDELVEDIGTRFNINSYGDEPAIKTTLVEGAVKVTLLSGGAQRHPEGNAVFLKPGEQLAVTNDNEHQPKIKVVKGVDVEDVTAWKDGRFRFSSVDIAVIMREAARWYDVEIIYQGKVSGTLSGGISRDVNISQLLHILELTGKVGFTVEGKEIIVRPVNVK